MTNVRAMIVHAAARIGSDEARIEAEVLLSHVLGRSRAWLFAHAEFEPDLAAQERFDKMTSARASGEPVAYLVGSREFFGLDLSVSSDVLIPRADTELLVDCALAQLVADVEYRVADLGTGSGAIALAIANARPQSLLTATDASAAAIAVARANAQRLGICNIEFLVGDWCAALGARCFEMIVSNPPYIAAGDVHLAREDLRFEPESALVSGEDGLDALRVIVAAAPRHLVEGGSLLVEHGFEQGEAVRALMEAAGFSAIRTARDIEQRERVTRAQWH